jgi:hypothetical protein
MVVAILEYSMEVGRDGGCGYSDGITQDEPSRRTIMTNDAEPLIVGKIYRLSFPGIAARVIKPPPGTGSKRFPYLVESLFLRSRWWVNELGEPDNISSPMLIIPPGSSARKDALRASP